MYAEAWEVVHHVPGRLRLRVTSASSAGGQLARVASSLRQRPEILEVRANAAAASLIISYWQGVPESQLLAWLAGPQLAARAISHQAEPVSLPSKAWRPATLAGYITALALSPLLPPPYRGALAAASLVPTLFKAIRLALRRELGHELFDAGALIANAAAGQHASIQLALVLREVARSLERQAILGTEARLRQLPPSPGSAQIWRAGELCTVQAAQVEAGERQLLCAGQHIAADGVLSSGRVLVRDSYDGTVVLEPGDAASAGAVVLDGQGELFVEAVGEATELARRGRFIERALASKEQAGGFGQGMADRLLPASLALSAMVFGLTQDVARAASVLQIDYAASLALAAPVSVERAMQRMASAGILVHGPEVLQDFARADTLVFDHTGSLTHPHLALDELQVVHRRWNQERLTHVWLEARRMACGPVLAEWMRHGEASRVAEHGLAVTLDGKSVVIATLGNLERNHGVAPPPTVPAGLCLGILVQGELVGVAKLSKRLREEAPLVLERLKSLGFKQIHVITRSGAEQLPALEQLPISALHERARPAEKAALLARLQDEGRRVVYVSDGVVPVAVPGVVEVGMAHGAQSESDAADIWLLAEGLEPLVEARRLACAAVRQLDWLYRVTLVANSAVLLATGLRWLPPVGTTLLRGGIDFSLLAASVRQLRI